MSEEFRKSLKALEVPNRVNYPLIELLAIELYNQDYRNWAPRSWLDLTDDFREYYRAMARGEADLSRKP